MRFGPSGVHAHIEASWESLAIVVPGTNIQIESGANANAHMLAQGSSTIRDGQPPGPLGPPVTNILGAVTFSEAYVTSATGSQIAINFSAFNGSAGVTCPKYHCAMNGTIGSYGHGVNYWPGNSAGILDTGGQYQ
jgi:hypothetical protein